MVAELDITDQDVTKIADMIDGEITSLVPEWRPGPGIEETPCFANQTFCHNCASTYISNGSFIDFLSNNPCCSLECASMHGRFGEITFEVDESENHITEGASNILNQSDYLHYQENWGQQESRQHTPMGSGKSHSDEEYENFDQSIPEKDTKDTKMENGIPGQKSFRHFTGSGSLSRLSSSYNDLADCNENEIQQDLRWLKAKYQMELRKLRDEQLGLAVKPSRNGEEKTSNVVSSTSMSNSFQEDSNGDLLKSLAKQISHSLHTHASAFPDSQGSWNHKAVKQFPRAKDMVNAKNFCAGPLLPHSLHRTTSLPVDAADV